MHIKIVIDDGSNFIKTAHKVNEEVIVNSFPSRVVRGRTIGKNYEVSNASYIIDGNEYAVDEEGEDVLNTGDRYYQTSHANRVLIHHALRMVGATTAEIILTLPVAQFFKDGSVKNTENIEAKKENALGEIAALDGSDCCTINKVMVMPEGVPAFKHVKNVAELEKGRFLMVDIGGTTTDMITFNSKSQIVKFVSLNLGSLAMLTKFKALCIDTIGCNSISDDEAMHGLLSGKLGSHDLSEAVEKCVSGFSSSVQDNIRALGDTALLKGVVYSGGGAQLLKLGTTENPQFDNVNGCIELFKDA